MLLGRLTSTWSEVGAQREHGDSIKFNDNSRTLLNKNTDNSFPPLLRSTERMLLSPLAFQSQAAARMVEIDKLMTEIYGERSFFLF